MTDIQKIGEETEKFRIIGRQIGRALTDEEMETITGGMIRPFCKSTATPENDTDTSCEC